MQVVDRDAIFDGFEAEFVRGAVADAALEAAAGHEHGEAVGVMVAAVAAFGDRRAAELAAPDDGGFVQQSAALEVADEGGRGLIHVGTAAAKILVDPVVVVPGLAGTVVDVDGADAALDQPAGQQATVGERRVAVFRRGWTAGSLADVERVGGFRLHAVGGLHRLDAAFEEFVLAEGFFVVVVELLDEVELPALLGGG